MYYISLEKRNNLEINEENLSPDVFLQDVYMKYKKHRVIVYMYIFQTKFGYH